MTDITNDNSREQGVEFGELDKQFSVHEFPATKTKLIEAYGESELVLQKGVQTLREVLEPFPDETYDSAEEARQAVVHLVDNEAIGRKGYSDRDPPAFGEQREGDSRSL